MELIEKYLRKAFDVFLFGNFFIACCAVALVYTSYAWMGKPLHFDFLCSFVFCSTLFQYSLHRFLAMRARKESHNYVLEWSRRNQFLIFMIALASGGAAANLAFQLSKNTLLTLIPIGVVSLLYEIPFKFRNKIYQLRNIWFFKTILIVVVWSFSTVVFPYLQYDMNIFNTSFILLFLHRCILLLMLAIAFDLRDLDYDKADKVNTIPVAIGLLRVRRLFVSLVCILFILSVSRVFFEPAFNWRFLIASVLSPIISYWFITLSYKYPKDYFYNSIVDGVMLIEVLLIILLNLF